MKSDERAHTTGISNPIRGIFLIVRWLRVILRSLQSGRKCKIWKKTLVGVRHKFSLGATCANDPGKKTEISIPDNLHWHENEADE